MLLKIKLMKQDNAGHLLNFIFLTNKTKTKTHTHTHNNNNNNKRQKKKRKRDEITRSSPPPFSF